MSTPLDSIQVTVTAEALPDTDRPVLITNEDADKPIPDMTPEIAAKVLALEFDPFTRAILEYLFDAPRTIEPAVGAVAVGFMGDLAADGEPENVEPCFAASPVTDPDALQIYGPAAELGRMLATPLAAGEITVADFAACLGRFSDKIENFDKFYGPGGILESLDESDCECPKCVAKRKEEGE